MQPLCPLSEWCCHEQGRVLESSAACPVHLCAVLPDGSAVLRAGCRGFGCAQTVFAEGELHVPAERLCGSAAAHACPCLVEERERFFSFGIVRLYRLDSSTAVAALVSVFHFHKKYLLCRVYRLFISLGFTSPK